MTPRLRAVCLASAIVAGAWLFLSVAPAGAEAQCAMCKTAVRAGGEQAAQTMRSAMLILLIPSVTLFCSIFAVVLKYSKKHDADGEGEDG